MTLRDVVLEHWDEYGIPNSYIRDVIRLIEAVLAECTAGVVDE